MASLNEVKMLGGIGSLLTLLVIVPSAGGVLAIVGLILILVAIKYASNILGDPKIFNNMLYAVVLGIIGIAIGVVAVAAVVLEAIGLGGLSSSFSGTPASSVAVGDILGLLGVIVIGLVAVWACFLVSSIFLRRSFSELGKRLNVGLFGTGALIYLIGAALTIVLVGFILIFIAEILFLVAFLTINTSLPPPTSPMQPAQPAM
jgi:uncharacterized membrane protein